jgi:hypothetical protein
LKTLLFRGGCSYKHTKKIRITVGYKKLYLQNL